MPENINTVTIAYLEGTMQSKISSRNHFFDTGKLDKAMQLNGEINHLWNTIVILKRIK